jgi:TrmH family RNA methyltransferase
VAEALDAGAEPSFVVTSPRLRDTPAGRDLAARLADLECVEVADAEIAALADTEHPQGVLLVCREPALGPADLPPTGLLLVLDAVQDPGNVGTLVRSAVAFGFDGVLCLDGTVDPWGAKAVRASAGMVFRIPVVSLAGTEAAALLASLGCPVLVASAEGIPVEEVVSRGGSTERDGWTLVVGNEGAGVREELRAVASAVVAVPMSGPAESLNVGIAGSILMQQIARSRA